LQELSMDISGKVSDREMGIFSIHWYSFKSSLLK
jgi:hypothetical protein